MGDTGAFVGGSSLPSLRTPALTLPLTASTALSLPLKGHLLTGGDMVLSQLCVVLVGVKGGDQKRKVQEGRGGASTMCC